jgi:hypothetical protein
MLGNAWLNLPFDFSWFIIDYGGYTRHFFSYGLLKFKKDKFPSQSWVLLKQAIKKDFDRERVSGEFKEHEGLL